jgi:hypothetical protein
LIYAMVAINGLGLAFGIVGAWLIWKNGLPPVDVEENALLLESSPDSGVIEKTKAGHARRSKRGMLFLLIGFALQFVGNLLTIFQ